MYNRHRRTRIYGANYDIGESYYKKQLNDLDNKKEITRSYDLPFERDTKKDGKFSPKVTFFSDDLDFNDKSSNIIKKINLHNNDDEDHIIQERSTYKSDDLSVLNEMSKTKAHDFKEESLIKPRNFKKFTSNDYDFDEDYIKGFPETTKELSVDINRYHKDLGNFSSRVVGKDNMGKQKSPVNFEEGTSSLSTMRSKYISERSIRMDNIPDERDASRRADATKARLLDLEEQITSITNKQNEREKRNKILKKFLSEVSSSQ